MIDVFKIGVSIGMTNNVSQVLRVIQTDLLGLRKSVDLTTGRFNAMKAAAIGAGGAIVSGGLLKGMWDLAKAGSAVNDQLAKMTAAGYGSANVAANKSLAAMMAVNIPGTTWSGNLATLAMLRAQLSNSAEARAAAPAVAKAEVAASVLGIGPADFQKLLKGLDIRGSFVKDGVLDPKTLATAVNEGVAALAISHGLLTGKDVFQYIRMAGPAADLGGLRNFLADNIEMMTALGRTGGRGLQYFWKTFVGGDLTKAEANALHDAGLVKGPIAQTGGHYALKPGQIIGYNDLVKNGPISWFYSDLLPKLAAHGARTPQQVEAALAAFPVTMQRDIAFLLNNEAQVQKGRAQFAKGITVNQYDALMKNSPAAQMLAFSKAWTALIQALGQPLVKPAYAMLNDLASALRGLESVALAHPTAVKVTGEGIAAVSGLLGALSALAISRAAIGGIRFLGSAAGLGSVARGFGLFATGETAAAGLSMMAGPAGFIALAAGINALATATASWLGLVPKYNLSDPRGLLAHDADERWGAGHWHWQHSWFWGDYPATGARSGSPPTVNLGNAHEVGRAFAAALNGGWRAPASHTPSVPTPREFPWAPGSVPAQP